MEVYYTRSIFSEIQGSHRWRTPPSLWIPNLYRGSPMDADAGGPGHFFTGGGLIRHGNTVYMLTTPDLTTMGWMMCMASSSGGSTSRRRRQGQSSSSSSSNSGSNGRRRSNASSSSSSSSSTRHRNGSSSSSLSSDHSTCQAIYESTTAITLAQQSYYMAPEIAGVLGHLVHLSVQHGFGLILLLTNPDQDNDASAMAGMFSQAVPLDDLRRAIDEPQITDFIEFGTAGGEEVTGLISCVVEYCRSSPSNTGGTGSRGGKSGGGSGGRSSSSSSTGGSSATTTTTKAQLLVVQTSSYAVTPADCGLWIRRSIASERPFLLGHVVGRLEQGFNNGMNVPIGEEVEGGQDYSYNYSVGGGGGGSGGGGGGVGASAEMLVLPFTAFAGEVHRTISSGRFNML